MSYRFEVQQPYGECKGYCTGSAASFFDCCTKFSKATARSMKAHGYSGPPMRGYDPDGVMLTHNNLEDADADK